MAFLVLHGRQVSKRGMTPLRVAPTLDEVEHGDLRTVAQTRKSYALNSRSWGGAISRRLERLLPHQRDFSYDRLGL